MRRKKNKDQHRSKRLKRIIKELMRERKAIVKRLKEIGDSRYAQSKIEQVEQAVEYDMDYAEGIEVMLVLLYRELKEHAPLLNEIVVPEVSMTTPPGVTMSDFEVQID